MKKSKHSKTFVDQLFFRIICLLPSIFFTDLQHPVFAVSGMPFSSSSKPILVKPLRLNLNHMMAQNSTENDVEQHIVEFQDPSQQLAAQKRLLNICRYTAIPALVRALQTEVSPTVRKTIAETVAYIGGTEAIEALTTALKSDPSPIVRKTAADGLGYIKDSSSAQVLIESLQNVNEDSSVREASAEALGLVGGRSAINALTDTLKNTSESLNLRNISTQALEKIGEPAIDSLVELLDDFDLQTRYYTVRTLSKINSFRSNNALQENQAKITEILEDAIKAEMVEFDRVPAAAAGRGTRDALRRPIICYIDWIAKNWDRCN